jgi:hypothetical protein
MLISNHSVDTSQVSVRSTANAKVVMGSPVSSTLSSSSSSDPTLTASEGMEEIWDGALDSNCCPICFGECQDLPVESDSEYSHDSDDEDEDDEYDNDEDVIYEDNVEDHNHGHAGEMVEDDHYEVSTVRRTAVAHRGDDEGEANERVTQALQKPQDELGKTALAKKINEKESLKQKGLYTLGDCGRKLNERHLCSHVDCGQSSSTAAQQSTTLLIAFPKFGISNMGHIFGGYFFYLLCRLVLSLLYPSVA